MKKVTTLFSAVLIALLGMVTVQAQTIFEEGLRADTMPGGWSATDVTFTTSAGGYARLTAGTGVLTTPSIDLSGVTGATLTYAVAKYGSGGDGPLTIEISTDGGTTWDAQLDTTGTPTSSTYLSEEVTLDPSVVGESDVMIRFSATESVSDKRLRDILIVGPDGETIPEAIEVSTIAELRAGTTDGETRYTLTGEALVNFYDSYQNRRYLGDGTAGIFSIDPNGNFTGGGNEIGDGLTGLTGTLSLENNGAVVQFTLDAGSESATVSSTGNVLEPSVTTAGNLSLDDTGKLVTVTGVFFTETGTFSTGTNYTLEDTNGNTLTFRTDYYSADYIGEAIPTDTLDITAVVGGYGSSPQIFARSLADMVPAAEQAFEPVTVTFRVNTSTIPDTLKENGFVQIRGELRSTLDSAAYGAQAVTWDASSTTVAESEGGDYWSTDVTMAPGDSLVYKYWIGLDSETGVAPNGGWEADGPFSGNYLFTLPENASQDSVVDLAYYNIGNGRVAPFEADEDSVTLYFRVNVGYAAQVGDFDPASDKVGIRGVPEVFQNPVDWSSSAIFLEKEAAEAPGDNIFYSKAIKVDKAAADTLDEISYKFVLETAEAVLWDNVDGNVDGNRFTNVPSQDSTVRWSFFQETAPTQGEIIDAKLTFNVDVGILEGLGYFNSSLDEVMLRGSFNGFGEEPMDFNGFTTTYEEVNFPISTTVGTVIEYKYYVKWDSTRFEEEDANYLPGIAQGAGWEEPGVTAGANRQYEITDQETQILPTEYYNGVPPEGLITENNIEGGASTMDVTFQVDMTDALSFADDPFDPESDSVFLFVDTPFFALSQGIIVPGDAGDNFYDNTKEQAERLLFTDENDDNIYTLTLTLQTPTLNHIGYRIAYGTPFTASDAGLTVNGMGASAEPGRRYYQYIQPNLGDDGITWPNSATLSVVDWVEPGEPVEFETPPNYGLDTSNDEEVAKVNEFSLSQNYPNPFNPTTNIAFKIGNASNVSLTVYNVLGQKVASLLNNRKMSAGSHMVGFDASNLSSGIYFYRLEAGSFVQQRSMTLIK